MEPEESDSLLRAIAAAPAIKPPASQIMAIALRPKRARDLARATELAQSLGGVSRALTADSLLITAPGTEPLRVATFCANCALALRHAFPAELVIVTARAHGELIARATAQLEQRRGEAIFVDDAIADQLDARFVVHAQPSGYVLVGHRRAPQSEDAVTTSSVLPKMHRLTLRFNDEILEQAFLRELDRQGPTNLRSTAISLLVGVACFAVYDFLTLTSERGYMWTYPILASLAVAVLIFCKMPERIVVRYRLAALLVFFYGVMLQALWFQATLPATASLRTFALYMISSASVYARHGLRFIQGSLVWPAYIGYALATCVLFPVPNGGVYVLWLIQGLFIGAILGHHLETSRRRLFLERTMRERLQKAAHDRDVRILNDELRRQIAQRAAKLSSALARLQSRSVTLQPGLVVEERYRVVRSIGNGGMGVVYEVERVADSHPLALKVLTRVADPAALARFAREAQTAAEIDHPNIVSVLDIDISRSGMLFLVMELVPGASLSAQREHYGELEWAVTMLRQIASALAAMHARGIIHRDLKPGNVLLNGKTVKIADFGLAGLIDDAPLADTRPAIAGKDSPSLTRTGAIMGTPLYMAPELVDGASASKPSSDVFSFGVLAYELLANRLPFAAPPVFERLARRAVASADPLAQVAPGVPVPLCNIIDRCLTELPEERPTAQEIWAVVEAH